MNIEYSLLNIMIPNAIPILFQMNVILLFGKYIYEHSNGFLSYFLINVFQNFLNLIVLFTLIIISITFFYYYTTFSSLYFILFNISNVFCLFTVSNTIIFAPWFLEHSIIIFYYCCYYTAHK